VLSVYSRAAGRVDGDGEGKGDTGAVLDEPTVPAGVCAAPGRTGAEDVDAGPGGAEYGLGTAQPPSRSAAAAAAGSRDLIGQ
jgi:hypothetical protein